MYALYNIEHSIILPYTVYIVRKMATNGFPDPAAEDEKELELDLDEMMTDLQELQVGNGLSNCLITMTLFLLCRHLFLVTRLFLSLWLGGDCS